MRHALIVLLFALAATTPEMRAADTTNAALDVIPSPYSLGSYESRTPPPLPASWKWSLAPFAASQGLDIASSYGMRELNPLLAGPHQEFGAKAALVKVGVTAAFVGVEYLIVKAHPAAAKIFTKINWSGAALTGSFAAHNWAIR